MSRPLLILTLTRCGQWKIELPTDTCWFALQCSVGFDARLPHGTDFGAALPPVMPWALLGAHGAAAPAQDMVSIPLQGYLVQADGSTSPVTIATPAELPTSSRHPFAQTMRDDAETHLIALARSQPPSVVWQLGDGDGPDEEEGGSLGKFLQYLSSLPGEVARQAGTVLYFSVAAGDLFTFPPSGEPAPRASRLWVAPRQLQLGGALDLSGVPAQAANVPYLESSYVEAGKTKVMTRGPGTSLDELVKPLDHPVFSLGSYGVDVRKASSDLLRLEALVLDAIDPATRARARTDDLMRSVFALQRSVGTAALPEEARIAARAADQVGSFIARCSAPVFTQACAMVGECLALQLVPNDDAESFGRHLARVVRPPAIDPPKTFDMSRPSELSYIDPVLSLGRLLGVQGASAKDMLLPLAAECTELTLCRLLAAELGRVLREEASLPPVLAADARAAWAAMADGADVSRQLALAQIGWRDWREQHEAQPLLDSLQDTTRATSPTPMRALRANVRAALAGVWTVAHLQAISGLLRLGWIEEGDSLVLVEDATDSALRIADAVLATVWSDEATKRAAPATSGGGFLFALGKEANELIHLHPKDQQEALWSDGFTQVSGFGVMVRRASPGGDDMAARPWRLVTGGLARLASGATLDTPLAVPQRVVFDRNVWRAETEYTGTHLLTRSALADAYRETEHEVGGADPGTPESLIAYAPPAATAQLAPPPLRYGDVYQVAAFVMDQGAGLPKAIAMPDAPWALDPTAFDNLQLSTGATVHEVKYRRTTPVGDLAIAPQGPYGQWPTLPKDVALRAKEWWQAIGKKSVQAPTVLLRDPADAGIRKDVPRGTAFLVFPPSVDEHVLLRWAAPPVGGMTEELKQDLVNAYTDLLLARAAGHTVASAAKELLPHDPAVRKIGLRATYVDAANQVQAAQMKMVDLVPVAANRPFVMRPVALNVLGDAQRLLSVNAAGTVTMQVPAGEFVCLEMFPLVEHSHMTQRFDADAVAAHIATNAAFPGFDAFEPAVFLAEAASSRLPAASDLYEYFGVSSVADRDPALPVECSFAQEVDALAMVDGFSIDREKWVWRNLPMAAAADLAGLTGPGLLRRLSGGLPDAAFTSPDDDASVRTWERVAHVDNGLSTRPPVRAAWPRQEPHGSRAGGPAGAAVLLRDGLEGSPQGMYLRYSLTVHSRYAPVIDEELGSVRMLRGDQTWRRCVAPVRTQRVRALKILGLVPLTESVDAAPPGFGPGARPFIVLLDETWFREYGVNERLEVVLALENPEIIADDPSGRPAEERDLRPFRIGRLPDHHLPEPVPAGGPYAKDRYFQQTLTNEAGAEAAPMRLQAFGPFGFTMDTTADEALANTTAFIVTPPAGWNVAPHWAMFVKLRRVLDYPASLSAPECQLRSDWSDAKSVYTLPDAGALCTGTGRAVYDRAAGTLHLDNLEWVLDPVREAPGAPSPARADYRYFLMVSRVVTDAGSEAEKEVPVGLLRVTAPATATLAPGTSVSASWIGTGSPPTGDLRGRLLEVWAEARLDGAPSRLDDVRNPEEFWNGLLAPIDGFGDPGKDDQPQEDAAGMVRRVSSSFHVQSR